MWKAVAGWILTFFGTTRELEEHRVAIRKLQELVRNHEEGLKLLALEMRHLREMEAIERDKQLLKVEREINRLIEAPRVKRKK